MSATGNGFFGYTGRVAYVDLSSRTVRVERPDPRLYRLRQRAGRPGPSD